VIAETFLEHVCPAVGYFAETCESQVRVGADVPLVRGETWCFLWVIQQSKFVGCCPGLQAFTVRRCFVVTPVDTFGINSKSNCN